MQSGLLWPILYSVACSGLSGPSYTLKPALASLALSNIVARFGLYGQSYTMAYFRLCGPSYALCSAIAPCHTLSSLYPPFCYPSCVNPSYLCCRPNTCICFTPMSGRPPTPFPPTSSESPLSQSAASTHTASLTPISLLVQ